MVWSEFKNPLTPKKIRDHFFAGSEQNSYSNFFNCRHEVLVLSDYSSKNLDEINTETFKYLNAKQALELNNELINIEKNIRNQLEIEIIEARKQKQKKLLAKLQHCLQLKFLLEIKTPPSASQSQLEEELYYSPTPVRFLVLKEFAQYTVNKIEDFSDAKTVSIKKWLGAINDRRLYWVWGGNLLATLIELLPNEFHHKTQAAKIVAAPRPVTGYMSWLLYYFRFGVELGLLLKHTIAGPWMTEDEKSIPTWKRFKSQWQQRKFALLNDSIWATLNLFSFFWLFGIGRAGYLGNLLTGVLLFMDLTFSIWKYFEKETSFEQTRNKIQKQIEELEALIKQDQDNAALQAELKNLKKIKKNYEFDWTYERYKLLNSIAYSVAILTAFTLMCSCFLPQVTSILVIHLSLVGSILSFAMMVIFSAIELRIEINKAEANENNLEKDFNNLLKKFSDQGNETDENSKKLIYLDMCQIAAAASHQKRDIHFQKLNFVRSILVDALVPPLIFASFVFLPLGLGFTSLGLGFAIIIATKIIMNNIDPNNKKQFTPVFDESKYNKLLNFSSPKLIDFQSDFRDETLVTSL